MGSNEEASITRLHRVISPISDGESLGEYVQSRLGYVQNLREQIPSIAELCKTISNDEFDPDEEIVMRFLLTYPAKAVVDELEAQALHYKSMMDVDDSYDWINDAEKTLDKVREANKGDVPF